MKANTEESAIKISYSQDLYLLNIDNKSIEKQALFNGIVMNKENTTTVYYFYDTGKIIGYDGCKPTS